MQKTIFLYSQEYTQNPIYYAIQGDTARELKCVLADMEASDVLAEFTSAQIYVAKPDGTDVYNNCTIETDGTITVPITSQTIAAVGKAKAMLQMTGANGYVSTYEFTINTLPTLIDPAAIESSNEWGALQELLANAGAYVVDDISDMTDTSKVYYVVSTAHCYAYDGNDWVEIDGITAAEVDAMITVETVNSIADMADTGKIYILFSSGTMYHNVDGEWLPYGGAKYGARRSISSSDPTLTRIWDAAGKTANVAVGSADATNDFDSIFPWSDIRVCNISVVNDEVRVNAYKGDLTFKRDGTNGQVAVEIPEFYWCPNDLYDGYETYGISATYQEGWIKSRKRYIGAYNAAADGDGLKSVSGVMPLISTSLTAFRTKARATDTLAKLIDIDDYNCLVQLFCTEFATLNAQSKMYGCAGMGVAYDKEHTIATVTSDTEFTCADADKYVEGQAISIGTSKNGTQRTAWVEIDTISGTTITLKTAVANLAVGDYISTRAWTTGNCDNVKVSGQMVDDQKHPMTYRGIENFYGNIFQWIDGVLINDYQPYICLDRTKFASTVTADYLELSYTNATSSGYASALGNDERCPQARFPTSVTGGANNKYYCDYYYQNTSLRACSFGGSWGNGASAGPFSLDCSNAPSNSNIRIGSRLSW